MHGRAAHVALGLCRAACNCSSVTVSSPLPLQVLDKQSNNVKALFRRSAAHVMLGDLQDAKADLTAVLAIEPGNRDLAAAMKRLKVQIKAEDQKDSKLFGAMFSKVGSIYKEVPMPKGGDDRVHDPDEALLEGEEAPVATENAEDAGVEEGDVVMNEA
jgi:hypothetical protein